MKNIVLVLVNNKIKKVLFKVRKDKWEIINIRNTIEGIINIENLYELSDFLGHCQGEDNFEVELEEVEIGE